MDRCAQRLGTTDGLPACPPCVPRCRAALAAQLQLKLRETGEHTSRHPPSGVRRVETFAKATQHNPALPKLTDGRHNLSGVATQPVDTDHDDGVALACVVQEGSEAGALLPRDIPESLSR